jgi:hypothetical protein
MTVNNYPSQTLDDICIKSDFPEHTKKASIQRSRKMKWKTLWHFVLTPIVLVESFYLSKEKHPGLVCSWSS